MKAKTLKVGLPLFIALVSGFAIFSWSGKTSSAQQKLAESIKQSEFVFEQYFSADYATAKEAMLHEVRRLDQLSAESERPSRNPYAVDAMIWYARLAKLEERNNGHEKGEYLQEARSRCEKLGWADCSEERLRSDVDRTDTIAFSQLRKR